MIIMNEQDFLFIYLFLQIHVVLIACLIYFQELEIFGTLPTQTTIAIALTKKS